MGTPGSSCTATTRPSQESFPGELYLPSWLVHGGIRDELPHPESTMLTLSTGGSGCLGIFPFSATGKAVAICASWVSIILLKLDWFLSVEDISRFTFRFFRVLSLAKSFLF